MFVLLMTSNALIFRRCMTYDSNIYKQSGTYGGLQKYSYPLNFSHLCHLNTTIKINFNAILWEKSRRTPKDL